MAKNPPSRYEIQDPMRALVMREAGLRDGRGGTPSAIAGSLMSGGMFDPAIGRAYRIGGTEVIPSGTLQFEPIVTNHGQADVVTRWKVTLKGTDPDHHIAAGRGAHLRFLVGTKMESDYIIRRGTIHVRTQNPNPNLLVQALDALDQGGAVTLYCVGRSLDVKVLNENAVAGNDLTVDYAIDEADSGLSIWHDLQTYNMILAGGIVETGFNIPPFCTSFQIISTAAVQVQGYGPGAVAIYNLAATALPISEEIPVFPGIYYTFTPSGAAQVLSVRYNCFG